MALALHRRSGITSALRGQPGVLQGLLRHRRALHLFRGYDQFYVYLAADLFFLILYSGAFWLFFVLFDFSEAYVLLLRAVSVFGCATAVFEFCYAAANHVNRTGV